MAVSKIMRNFAGEVTFLRPFGNKRPSVERNIIININKRAMMQISTFKRMTLMLVMMMGILPVIGQTPYTTTFTSNKWEAGQGEPTWTASENGRQLESERGVQWGKNSGSVTLTSDAAYTQVAQVVVVASSNGDDGVIKVKVVDATGEVELTTESTLVKGDRNKELIFSSVPAPSGKIVITASEGDHSIWIKSISVTAVGSDGQTGGQPGGGDEPGDDDEPGGDITPIGEGIALNDAFFGTSWGGSKPAGEPDDVEGQDEETGVLITYYKDEGSNMYINDSQIRLYSGNKLSVASTNGVNIAQIDFTVVYNDGNKELTANVGSVNGYSWTGDADEVVFSVSAGKGHLRISHVKVTFVGGGDPVETPDNVSVNISDALVAGFSSNYDVDFTSVKGLSAWTATGFGDNKVMLSRAYVVPAGTGVYLKADTKGSFTIPTTSRTMYYSNLFVGVPNGKTVQPTETYNGEKFVILNFALSKSTGLPAFFPLTEPKTFGANKMYLHLPARLLPDNATREIRVDIVFDEEDQNGILIDNEETTPTGINDASRVNDKCSVAYDLQGRRIDSSKLQKGIYLMNGKKMLVK